MKIKFLTILLCLIGTLTLSAQINYNYGHDNFLRLEFNKPIFSDDFNVNFISFDAYLNGEFRVGEKNKIAFELPFSRTSFDTGSGNNNNTELGNIAIAYQLRNLENLNYFEFKLRLPTANDDAFFGNAALLLTDYTERFSSIIPNLFSLEGSYNLESTNNEGLYYRFRPGLKVLIPTEDTFDDKAELLLDLNILGGYRTQNFDVNAGLTTTSVITESDIDFDERVLRQFLANFTYTGSAFKPGLLIRVPQGDFIGGLYDVVVAAHVTYTFGGKTKVVETESN